MTRPASIPELLIRHAEERGQKVAFSGPGCAITYSELEKRTRQIAANLVRAGIGRGHFVAIVLGRCVEAVESVLAVTRAGAVAVPLDPRSPPADLARTLAHCGTRAIFTEDRYLGTVRAAVGLNFGGARPGLIISARTSDVDEDEAWRYEDWTDADDSRTALSHQAILDDLGGNEEAFLHYTSGTTSLPKGVLSTQQSWLWSAERSASAFGMTQDDQLFWPLPLFHCLGHALCIVATVVVGASSYIPGPDETPFDSLFAAKGARGTTVIVGTPATYHELIARASTSTSFPTLPGLRACMSAGSSATTALSTQVQEVFGVPFLDNYGCTEACGAIAIHKPGDLLREDSSGTILSGMEVRLTGPDGNEVRKGETGEVWIRSPSLMLRYFKQTESPFTAEGWFRTGDVARRSTNATDLNLVGRRKELIVQGGENIQPDELERVLLRCPGVADVVVAGISHIVLGETAAAFIVPEGRGNALEDKSTADLDPMALLAWCRKDLPDHKVPTVKAFYEIDTVPRTQLGKPRRSAMLSSRSRPLIACSKLLTRESIEELVLGEVIGACNLDAWPEESDWNSTFAHLGVKSLSGVLLRDRLCSLTGLNLPTTLLFNYPSPAAVSVYLYDRLLEPGRRRPLPPPPPPPPMQARGPGTNVNSEAEPIAIISMACRYPGGVTSAEDLWRIVADEVDVTSEFPTDRGWNLEALYSPDHDTPGTTTTRRGAFLENMADFDAGLFGMAPREALATDPQQRLLLETTWELMERSRMAPSSLRGTKTGVYVGIMYGDYEENGQNNPELEAHLGLGSSGSVVAGRVSYCFDLHGPSICVHSGCSSSLVAIHLATSSLRSGESTLAIAGGVTTMASPKPFVLFSKRRGLSADGRCRAYSSDADGTVWSEGVGLLLLERLDDARRNGHRVLGLVRGSAVNSDGASNGLTAPSGPAQQQVIQAALAQAALSPTDVDVLEGHGTATALGDPIEVQAVISAYGNCDDETRRLPSAPLLLGSVKSNIGHSQAAAGVAGVIKMVEAMRHGIAPASLHISQPSRHIEWQGSGVELLTNARPWPAPSSGQQDGSSTGGVSVVPSRPRRAAVSSFGIGGTNAHIILEQTVEQEQCQEDERVSETHTPQSRKTWTFPWLLSGADEVSLNAQARALLADEALANHNPVDIAFSLATTRSALHYRAAVMSNTCSGGSHQAALTALGQGRPHPDVAKGAAKGLAKTIKPRLACVFSGQGGRLPNKEALEELCAAFPIFSEAFRAACDALELDLHFDVGGERLLYAAMGGDAGKGEGEGEGNRITGLLNPSKGTGLAQAAIFAFEVAMFRLLQSFGISPDFVAGHSLGELVAAHVAGALSLREAAAIVTARARLMATLPANGAMVSISATEDEVAEHLSQHQHETEGIPTVIAVVNSQNSVVVSGTAEAVAAVAKRFTDLRRRVALLRHVHHAFHSPMMDPILDDFREALAPLLDGNGKMTVPLVSTVTGKPAEAAQLSSWKHWTRHIRELVRFADAIEELQNQGISVFLEVGPSAILSSHMPDAIAISSQVDRLLETLGRLWVRGVQLDWQAIFEGSGACLVDLPVYAFQRRRYWLDPPKPAAARHRCPDAGALDHGILLSASSIPETGKIMCSGYLSASKQAWLRDHVIGGKILVPATAFAEMALRASRECTESQEMMVLEELVFAVPLALSEEESRDVQVVVGEPQEKGKRKVDIYSRPSGSATRHEWTRHATGTLEPRRMSGSPSDDRGGGDEEEEEEEQVNERKRPTMAGITRHGEMVFSQTVDVSRAYATLGDRTAISYGPSFQSVRDIWHRPGRDHDDGEGRAELRVRIDPPRSIENQRFALHPALLDAALHASLLAAAVETTAPAAAILRLPFLFRGVQFLAPAGPGPMIAHVRDLGEDRRSMTLRSESTGALVAKISEVVTRASASSSGRPVSEGDLYRLEWTKFSPTKPKRVAAPEGNTDEVYRVSAAHSVDAVHNVNNVHNAVMDALRVVQKWIADKAYANDGRLIVVTERATAEEQPDPVAAAVWGLIRSAQAELGESRIVLIDVDGSPESEAALLPALASSSSSSSSREGQVLAVRGGKSMTPSLVRFINPDRDEVSASAAESLDVSGTVLVTGATGGLGALLSRHVVAAHGAKHLLLLSRSGMKAPRAPQLYKDLQKTAGAGAVVRIEACDCADREQLAAVLAASDAQGHAHPPVSAVLHCAGVVDDGVLSAQRPDRVARVLRAKVDAAWNLHELVPTTAGSFVLFSSCVGIVGNEGQAGYSAGNAFLDALARLRVARGLPALSLAWGPWMNEGGMAAVDKLAVPHSARLAGAQPLTDLQGLQLFDFALRNQASSTSNRRRSPVLVPLLLHGPFPLVSSASIHSSSTAYETVKTPAYSGEVGTTWGTRLAASDPERRDEALMGLLRDETAAVLGYREDQDIPDLPFADLGFDSFTSVSFTNRLRAQTGLRDLPVTLALDLQTIQSLAQYLAARLDLARLELGAEPEREPDAQLPTALTDMEKGPRPALGPHPYGTANRATISNSANPAREQIDLEMFRGIAALYKRLSLLGQYTAASDMLATASLALPTFNNNNTGSNLTAATHAVAPQRLATGPSGGHSRPPPTLVFVAPFSPPVFVDGSRRSVYSALAAAMEDERGVFELPHPGEQGPAVPQDIDALAAVHASTIRQHFAPGPIILAGYSAGGVVAHAVAAQLAEEDEAKNTNREQQEKNVQLAGLVLIDTYLDMKGRGDPDWFNALPAAVLTKRVGETGGGDGGSLAQTTIAGDDVDLALVTVGGYFRMLRDLVELRPLPATLSTLFLRAQHPAPGMPEDEHQWRPSWPRADFTVDIPGSHLELLNKKYAPIAAAEIQRWSNRMC